ncbi:uncharacterized protein EAF02_000464 [Botrytis sinoallii]|uniref:uncharacterized protein n=1 Tax=Botrytis sinoallii TaxID=1463999 RepID=UPI001900C586|nr:uncharacterized protein EAF02_000464 [Botrytis sinoallii]KAF7892926.1 hypothetical protein EAF02_000464 [Botrytis sinoallii]
MNVESLDSWGRCKCEFLHCYSLLVQRAPRIEVWNPNTMIPNLGLGNLSKSPPIHSSSIFTHSLHPVHLEVFL